MNIDHLSLCFRKTLKQGDEILGSGLLSRSSLLLGATRAHILSTKIKSGTTFSLSESPRVT